MVDVRDLISTLPAGLLVDGTWRDRASGGGVFEHRSPSTGELTKPVPDGSRADVESAVDAARRAQVGWRRTPVAERVRLLHALARRLDETAEEMAHISAVEGGTPLSRFAAQPPGVAGAPFAYAASWADKLMGRTVSMELGKAFDFTLVEPLGVIAVIPTWNGPMWSVNVAVAPALAVGCTVVLKPPELAPFTSMRFAQLCLEVGLPPGVVNVVPGGSAAGEALVRHPEVDKIHFTGGIETARRVQAAAAAGVTPLVLELGGKSANIVFEDADLDRAAASAANWIPVNAGQSCVGASRLLVQRDVVDDVVTRVVERLRAVRVGDPFDPESQMGPVISATACDRILAAVGSATGRGAEVVLGGERLGGSLAAGSFLAPTVVVGLDEDDPLAREEVFGPVVVVLPFDDEEDALRIANDSPYGLAGYLHTRDLGRALRLASEIDAGNIGINGTGGMAPAGPSAPFGGFKDSGYGKENGIWGMEEVVRTKNVYVALDGA